MNVVDKSLTSSKKLPSTSLGDLLAFLVTPTRSNGDLDEQRLCSLADSAIAGGADTVTLFGSTGSIGSFNEAERLRAAEALLNHVGGRAKVVVGTGAMTTAEAIRLSVHAEKLGASAVLVVPITYWLLNDAELLAHYSAIGRSISTSICIYNNPRLTGVDITPPLIARMADEISNVKYLKESSPELGRVSQTKRLLGDRIDIFAGRDSTAVEALRIGASAWTSGVANFCPQVCRTLVNLAKNPGSSSEAWEVSQFYAPLFDFCMTKGLVRSIHAALDVLGRGAGNPRLPIQPLSVEDYGKLSDLLKNAKVS